MAQVLAACGHVMTLGGGDVTVPDLDIAVGIAFLAGVSTLLGHGAVLYINRVTGLRGAAALALSGILLVLLYGVNAVVLDVVGILITGTDVAITEVAAITLASTAPLVLGIFGFVPVIGLAVGRLLNAWSALALWALIVDGYGTTWPKALLTAGTAWLVMQLGSRLLGPAISRVVSRLWQVVTGVPTQITARDILAGTPIIPVAARRIEPTGEVA